MKATKVILTIIIPIMIILFCFRIYVFNADFYEEEFEKRNIYETVPRADYALTNLLSYLEHGTELSPDLFSEREIVHMQDVRSLIWKGIFLLTILFLLFIVLLLKSFFIKDFSTISQSFMIGSGISLVVAVVVLLLSIFSFDSVFTNFHLLLFNNDFWILPSDSMMVRMLPIGFFYDIAKKMLLNCIYLSLFFMVLGYGSSHLDKEE